MLRLLSRAVRAHQLYLHNYPTSLRAVENVKASFAPIWSHADELFFVVTDTQVIWEGHPVVDEADKSGDALPWVLFKDGIREVRLTKGVEDEEVVTLLQIIARVRKASTDEDELLTLLWEQEFTHVHYRYVDVGFETAVPIEATEEEDRPHLVDPTRLREPAQEQLLPVGVVSMDDFDSTLYFLDDGEIQGLKEQIVKHYDGDMRRNVVTILLDVFEQQTDPAIRDETSQILDGMLVSLLAGGHLRAVATLLREVNVAATRSRELTPIQREMLLSLPNRMSEPAAVAQFLQALDEGAELPPQEDLNEVFDQLRVSALGTIFTWLWRITTPEVRKLLEGAADRLAAANTSELVRLLGAAEREIVLEAARRAGSLKAAAAVPALARLAQHADAEMRLPAVTAMGEIGTPGAMQHLEKAIEDSEREVRVAAVRFLAARGHRASVQRLEATISGRRLPTADLTEKMAFFEAYGALCGEAGVSLLDGLLNKKGIFGKREDPEWRACAARALGRIGSEPALAALQRAANDKDILVRNAVSRAMRGGAA
jgi:HEAT repeat protein